MMNGWQTVFDSFYTRFVLRDFFGKIVPGGILIFAIAVSATSTSSVVAYLASMSFFAWVAIFGVSWLIAFAIQSFGEKPLPGRCSFSFIRYYPKSLEQQQFYDMYIRFHQNALPNEMQQVERLVVIKEACGNGYVAIAISLVLVVVDTILNRVWVVVPFLIVAFAAVYYLRQMHFICVQREHDYMVQALKTHGPESVSSSK